MLRENIQKFRRERGMSQEELAEQLHVVRQTVSKWERGASSPDADMVFELARVLQVTPARLLDLPEGEAADLREKLAEARAREERMRAAEKPRGAILFLSMAALAMALGVQNAALSLALTGLCLGAALWILGRNVALLTDTAREDPRLGVLQWVTGVNLLLLTVGTIAAVLMATGVIALSEERERLLAAVVVMCVMILVGLAAPRLPRSRHTGLRLPWTVQDEETWNLAHRILGIISTPLALLYGACAATIQNLELVTLVAILLWVGIPGGISGIFFWRKIRK